MHIRSIRILNYKSFKDSGEIAIPSSFTVVTGKNNAGKTAFTQALSLTIEEKPYRGKDTAPTPSTPSKGPSEVLLSIVLTTQEFYELVSIFGDAFNLAKAPNSPDASQLEAIQEQFSTGLVPLYLQYRHNGFAAAYLDISNSHVQSEVGFQLSIPSDGSIPQLRHNSVGVRMDRTAPFMIAPSLRGRIYLFKAERFNVGQYQIGPDPTLLPDASNLAQALNNLQTRNPSKYEELIFHVRTIFPDVQYVTVPPHESGGGHARITVWPLPIETQRADLAIPLQESGTGLGQVLAILYVAISADFPRTIVIDEPQSFLHPGAIRTLIGILQRRYSHHQYILTTHSPIVLTSAVAPAIIHLSKADSQTRAQVLDPSDANALRAILGDVGARLSDVFGADSILWVEGRTEEACLPLIIAKLAPHKLPGTAVVGVLAVGDFQGKHAEKIVAIYNRLSKGNILLPPAVAFIFDKEGKSTEEQEDLTRMSHNTIRFLPRRMYENYLIHPRAIALVLDSLPDFPKPTPDTQAIDKWIRQHSQEYVPKGAAPIDVYSTTWLVLVDGASLLQRLFLEMSDTKHEYDKVDHGLAITECLCEIDPSALSEVADLIQSLEDEPAPQPTTGA